MANGTGAASGGGEFGVRTEKVIIRSLDDLSLEDGVARALLWGSVCYFRRAGAQIFRCRFLKSTTTLQTSDVRRLGFFYRKGRRHTLLVKFADRVLHQTAHDTANWSYTVGDGEGSFWTR